MKLSESDLVSKIEILLQRKYKTYLTFREVSAGYGITDLVIASPGPKGKPYLNRVPITHFSTLQIYLSLGRRSYRFEQITELEQFISPRNLRRYINFLVENGYIIKTGEYYRKSNLLENQQPIKRVIAIEAKLSDYRSGIIQARRYQYFADQSYLALPKKSARHIDSESLKRAGIGLIIFDELTERVQVIKPIEPTSVQQKLYRTFAREIILKRMNLLASAS